MASEVAEAAPGSQSHRMVAVERTSGGHLLPNPCSSKATDRPSCLPVFLQAGTRHSTGVGALHLGDGACLSPRPLCHDAPLLVGAHSVSGGFSACVRERADVVGPTLGTILSYGPHICARWVAPVWLIPTVK